ncbi:CHASE2 domain-containing protein [Aerosakkonema sp. BLCC-F2]
MTGDYEVKIDMIPHESVFRLKVQRIHQTCLFELSWGRGLQLSATLEYPESLTRIYQDWQRTYLNFYKSELRGRVENSGTISIRDIDWHAKLVEVEANFLRQFRIWLRSAELYEIRRQIVSSHSSFAIAQNKGEKKVDLFLTCSPLELARLPWEAWEIGSEFTSAAKVRIFRTPLNIRAETIEEKYLSQMRSHGRRKARLLAILGDDRGLNFEQDLAAVRALDRIVEIKFVGWQPGREIAQLKAEIREAIADEQGWDILFFAGHSNETNFTGGEVAIAPGASILISEIAPQLTIAKKRGLQFAIFNSCSGLRIAESLIDLGLSQVAVMREPIHNAVAQAFLVQFLRSLAADKDVWESLQAACEYFQLEKNYIYPSAYLIPSLFCHPDAVLFRLKPHGVKQHLKQLLPTRQETIAVLTLILLSLQLPVQGYLLERRVLLQAIYRQVTGQIPNSKAPPPVLLVQIDQRSIDEGNLNESKPMPRDYLAKLVDRLSALNVRVIGLDYLLVLPRTESDRKLSQSLRKAVQKQPYGTWFIFVETQDETGQRLKVLPEITSPKWSLQGDMAIPVGGYMKLAPGDNYYSDMLPFSYLLALAYQLNFQPSLLSTQPRLESREDFIDRIKNDFKHQYQREYTSLFASASHLQPITAFSYNFGQTWLHPILDFSIPPERVYERIPAWQLLRNTSGSQLSHIQQQAVMIVPGGYLDAGVSRDGEDNFPLPAAIAYWRRQNDSDTSRIFTGGEIHAYMLHHHLTRSAIVPIPDLWAIAIAALLGKATALVFGLRDRRRQKWAILLICITLGYGLISLQLYISAALLLPFVLPLTTLTIYALPAFMRKKI